MKTLKNLARRYVRRIKSDRKKYLKNSDKIRQNLVESLYDNPQTKLMAMEFQDLDTTDFYQSVVNRVKDTSVQSLNCVLLRIPEWTSLKN